MKNKNKIILGLLMLCMAVILPACGKKEKELDAEEQQVKEELQAVFSDLYDEVDSDYNEEKDIDEEKASFDPNEPGIRGLEVGTNLAPDEMGIFDVFGFDENFPMPKESFEVKWRYSTHEYIMDSKTGERQEGVREYELELNLSPQSYSDYLAEIVEYIQEKFGASHTVHLKDPRDASYGCFIFLDDDYVLTFDGKYIRLIKAEKLTVEGTVAYHLGDTFIVETDDGTEHYFPTDTWSIQWYGMDEPYYIYEFEYPKAGDRVKVTYLNFNDGLSISSETEYIIDFEYLSTVNDGGSDDGEDSTDLLDEAEESETE